MPPLGLPQDDIAQDLAKALTDDPVLFDKALAALRRALGAAFNDGYRTGRLSVRDEVAKDAQSHLRDQLKANQSWDAYVKKERFDAGL